MNDAREPPPPVGSHLQAADLHGLVQLATQATLGVTDIVEGVHQAVWRTLGFASGARTDRTRGITGFVYGCVRSTTTLAGDTLASVSKGLTGPATSGDSAQRLDLLSAINGVLGDRLAKWDSPFAIPMSFRQGGRPFEPTLATASNPKLVLLIHGLCLNDQHWGGSGDSAAASDHGCSIAEACGHTPVYLRYNSGRHVSENGRELAYRLEELVDDWPVALEELCIVGHSMGGLVARSAVHYACEQQLRWPQRLRKLIFLGTPHHGSALERAGNWVDDMLTKTPYSTPFAQLGHLRSCGISDLRHGLLLDQDWRGHDRFARVASTHQPVPLPRSVHCYAVAGSLSAERTTLAQRITGDGLVTVRSAFGAHANPERNLAFEPSKRMVAAATGHIALLRSTAVQSKLLEWLGTH